MESGWEDLVSFIFRCAPKPSFQEVKLDLADLSRYVGTENGIFEYHVNLNEVVPLDNE